MASKLVSATAAIQRLVIVLARMQIAVCLPQNPWLVLLQALVSNALQAPEGAFPLCRALRVANALRVEARHSALRRHAKKGVQFKTNPPKQGPAKG